MDTYILMYLRASAYAYVQTAMQLLYNSNEEATCHVKF